MSKVIHTSNPARYVVQCRDRRYNIGEWYPWKSFHSREDAISESDEQARDNPHNEHRVVDTTEEEEE